MDRGRIESVADVASDWQRGDRGTRRCAWHQRRWRSQLVVCRSSELQLTRLQVEPCWARRCSSLHDQLSDFYGLRKYSWLVASYWVTAQKQRCFRKSTAVVFWRESRRQSIFKINWMGCWKSREKDRFCYRHRCRHSWKSRNRNWWNDRYLRDTKKWLIAKNGSW